MEVGTTHPVGDTKTVSRTGNLLLIWRRYYLWHTMDMVAEGELGEEKFIVKQITIPVRHNN